MFDIQLGKMLQISPLGELDELAPYLKASSLRTGSAILGEDQMWASPSDLAKYAVRSGDLLVVEGGDVGRSAIYSGPEAIHQNSLHRVRPTVTADLRFGMYLLEMLRGTGYLDVLCNVATIRHFTAEKLGALEIPWPQLEEQRGIADFLDDQVSRIDRIVSARAHQAALLQDATDRSFVDELSEFGVSLPTELDGELSYLPEGWRMGELCHLLRELTNGYVGPTRDILTEGGVAYVQSLHIKDGRIDFDRRPYFVTEEWHRQRPRIHLQPGDVLIVQTGAIGEVAVVPEGFRHASCHALQIARVDPALLSGAYLGEYLRSPFGRAQLLSRATGALHPHLEGGIRSVPVVVPDVPSQAKILDAVSRVRREAAELQATLAASIDVLAEFRRSLISAAVSGEFDVSSASGRGVPA